MIWAGVKLFTCGALYLIALNNTVTDYDTSMVFLFLNFGILANGVLIYRIREFKETYVRFTARILVPVYLHYTDAINFM